MRISSLLAPEAVFCPLAETTQADAIAAMVQAIAATRNVDHEKATADIAAREELGATLIPHGDYNIAIPHAFTGACKQLVLGLAVSREGVSWHSTGKKAHTILLVLGPPQTHALYLKILSRLAILCRTSGCIEDMLSSRTPAELISELEEREKPLGDIAPVDEMPVFCVVGAGHGGLAMAGYLALTGCRVRLYNRTPEHIEAVRARQGIQVEGEMDGFGELECVTSDPAEALSTADVVMVVVPATAHSDIAKIVAPHIRNGQILVLNPGRTGGALEVARVLSEENPDVHPYITEAQTLLFAARAINPGQVHIFGIKNSVPVAAFPSYFGPDILPVLRKALPQFVPGDDVLKTSFDNIGPVFHPAITILNAARIEDTHGDFHYYVQGVTPAVARILEKIDAERVAVADALGIRAHTAREWLYFAYDAAGKTLYDAMRANPGYRGITAPATVRHRYITEDVPTSLVPIASIGDLLGVATPAIHAIVELAGAMEGVDYWKTGRTVEKLGIQGMTVKQIRFMIAGIAAVEPSDSRSAAGPQ